jgi:hypothetical protein
MDIIGLLRGFGRASRLAYFIKGGPSRQKAEIRAITEVMVSKYAGLPPERDSLPWHGM